MQIKVVACRRKMSHQRLVIHTNGLGETSSSKLMMSKSRFAKEKVAKKFARSHLLGSAVANYVQPLDPHSQAGHDNTKPDDVMTLGLLIL